MLAHKHHEISEETLVASLGGDASQPWVRWILGDVVKQLNLGLRVIAAKETTDQDVDAFSIAAASEAMSIISSCVSYSQENDSKSARVTSPSQAQRGTCRPPWWRWWSQTLMGRLTVPTPGPTPEQMYIFLFASHGKTVFWHLFFRF